MAGLSAHLRYRQRSTGRRAGPRPHEAFYGNQNDEDQGLGEAFNWRYRNGKGRTDVVQAERYGAVTHTEGDRGGEDDDGRKVMAKMRARPDQRVHDQ